MRLSWDQYFLSVTYLSRLRSNCIKRKVGCVVVDSNHRIVSTGYNGTPHNVTNCIDGGCSRCYSQYQLKESSKGQNLDLCICVHAEQNALLRSKQDLSGCTLYSTLRPCIECTKSIIQCGIKRVVYIEEYNQEFKMVTDRLFQQTGTVIEQCCITFQDIYMWNEKMNSK